MKYVKMLGLLAVAAAALMAFAGTASANLATSPLGTPYTSTLTATSTDGELDGLFTTVKCSHSEVKGKIESHGKSGSTTLPVSGKISSLSFTGCNYAVTVKQTGTLSVNGTNTVTSNGAAVEIHTSVGTCVFTTNNTPVGTLTEGANASLDIAGAKIPRTGGNFLCGSSGEWTGTYDLKTPNDLWID